MPCGTKLKPVKGSVRYIGIPRKGFAGTVKSLDKMQKTPMTPPKAKLGKRLP